jgi:hypothetical protein
MVASVGSALNSRRSPGNREARKMAAPSRTANQRQQAFFFPATDFLGTGAN